ncbi:hypothetical protein L2E82_02622 [Cichorium intybus]|uniref:Uncharacterized protein n=1 Tax=Cichorium intybus TaxID=13427 RepID=A0ACB9H1V0_CICIN|nr:hypothetical protein L2E82_02622 [Cichorium intybus]
MCLRSSDLNQTTHDLSQTHISSFFSLSSRKPTGVMEEDGEETPRTPFWIQSTNNVRRAELYRRRASSLFFNFGVLIILLLLFAVLSMVFIIPSVISFTSQIFRPNLVKRSWDSINLVLVLVALAFGFLSRNINNEQKSRFDNGFDRSRSDLSTGPPVVSPSSSTPHQWYDFPEQPIGGGLRRHRSTSSYPDLRELSQPWNHRTEVPWRFSDDTHLHSHRVLNYDRYYFRREPESDTKEVYVDTAVDLPKEDSYAPPPQPPIPEEESYSPSPQPPAPEDESNSRPSQPPAPEDETYSPPPQLPTPQSLPPQPPAPRPSAKKKPIRTYHNVAADDGEKHSRLEVNEVLLPETEPPVFQDSERKGETSRKRGKGERRRAKSSEPRKLELPIDDPTPESQSPPRIWPEFQDSERNTGGVERKRTGANATKRFFTSFYQKKKKRQRQRSLDNLDNLLRHPQPPVIFQLPPPSPPPPPPPPPPPHPSVLNNLFTPKKERRKKIPSAAPPPPPPPPPRSAARAPRTTITRVSPFITEKPRVPVKMSFFNGIDDTSSGGESPMSRIPPPPPMPPFKMPDWKFAVEGDYVRVQSTLSSGSVSPDGDEAHSPSSAAASPLFCPSPDVDTKADTFIARFRAGLKLEKINSFNQNQGLRMSNLGPGPSKN